MERTEVLAQMLGVLHAFDEDTGMFLVCPDKLAFGVVASPLAGGDDATADKINMILQLPWPAETLVQFCCYTSPDLLRITTQYEDLRSGVKDSLMKKATREHVEFMRRSALRPYDANSGARLRNTQLIITVQMPYKGSEPDEITLELARELRGSFEQTLRSAGVRFNTMRPRDYIRILETMLNQGPDAGWKNTPLVTYDENQLVCAQVVDPGSAIDVDEDGLWVNGCTRVRVLSPKRYPDAPYFGLAMRYLTDPEHGARGIRENALITLNVLLGDRKKETDKLEQSEMWNTKQASSPISKYVRHFRDKRESLQSILDPVRAGDRPVKAYVSMALFVHGENASPEERRATERKATAAVANAQAYWREFGYQMLPERFMVAPFFFQMLPFAGDAAMRKASERYRPMAGIHAVCLAPVLGEWRGTGTPLMTLFARDGQVQPISPWDTEGGMNFMVCAATGSGKSVFAQALISAMNSIGGKAWVLDIGSSYRNLCETNGGQYLSFGPNDDIRMPIFEDVTSFEDQVDLLTDLMAVMIAPRDGLNEFQTAYLKHTIEKAWEETKHQTTIDRIAELLSQADRTDISDLALQLRPFTSVGSYGRFFRGPSNINFNRDMVVVELSDLKEKPLLQRVILLVLMNKISSAIYRGDRSRKQMLLIDEAWELLSADATATFVEKAYRQFRKHAASVGVVTQSVMDVYDTKGGRAMADNTEHFYLLRQKAESIEGIRKENRLSIGDWGYDKLKTVHTDRGKYAEIMCITPYGTGIGRLVLNNFQKVLFSTTPEDVVAIKKLRDQGLDLGDAVGVLVRERFGEGSDYVVNMPAPARPKVEVAA